VSSEQGGEWSVGRLVAVFVLVEAQERAEVSRHSAQQSAQTPSSTRCPTAPPIGAALSAGFSCSQRAQITVAGMAGGIIARGDGASRRKWALRPERLCTAQHRRKACLSGNVRC
jgi:hypothetical protein